MMQIAGGICIVQTLSYVPMTPVTFRAKQVYLTIAFWGMLAASMVLALRWFGGALHAFDEFGITAIVFFVVVVHAGTAAQLRRILMVVAFLPVMLAIQSIAAIHLGFQHDILILGERLADGSVLERVRGTGFMKDPNDLSQTLVMAFPFLALAWRKYHLPQNFILVLVPMALMLYAIFLSHSRGAILSLLVILMVAVSRKAGQFVGGAITAAGAVGALAANFAGGRAMAGDASTTNRVEYWSMGLQMLKQHPFAGVGYDQFSTYNAGMTAHNSFVLCFGELGFPAFVVWIALLLVALVELRSIRKFKLETKADVELKRMAGAIELGMYGFLVSAWFLSRTYVLTLYLLLALSAAVADIARRAGKPLNSPSLLKLGRMSVMASIGLIVLIYATIKFSIR